MLIEASQIWNPGTENACTTHPCQHKKCEDCLWESLEPVPSAIKVQSVPQPKQVDIQEAEQDDAAADEEVVDEETNPMETAMMMPPPSIPSSRGINRDPRTGRPRLWTKN